MWLTVDMQPGDKVWLKLPYVDDECWVTGVVEKVNPKTLRCFNEVRGMDGNYAPHNVRARTEGLDKKGT